MNDLAESLRRVINARAIAVVGASSDTAKFGGRVMQFLTRHGYGGGVVPVNPNAQTIFGHTAYKSVRDAGIAVDVALLAVPAQHLASALEECGAAGVACAVVITAEFAEMGEEGAAREALLVRIARTHGMRIIGPNCLGFINPHIKLALTSSVALAVEPMPAGCIGLVSQSGSMMASMISRASDTGAGFSACVTVGNQADLETCDFIEYFVQDEATRAICAYIEGLKDGARFLELAKRCRDAGKPLLALKTGSSEAGAQIARSHTASLAGSHAVWKAACRDSGVIAIDDPESLIDCAHFLSRFGGARSRGIAALSPSGGTIAVTADRIAGASLELAQLAPATRDALRQFVPHPRPLNPLDVGGLPRDAGLTAASEAQALLARDPAVGIVFIVVATTPQLDDKVRTWAAAALASGKPTAVLFTPGTLVDGARKAVREMGCPYTDRMDDALRVIRAALDYGAVVPGARNRPQAPSYIAAIRKRIGELPSGFLTELEAKSLLHAGGIKCPRETFAATADAAVAGAERIGYPVVLKAVSRELIHKSDHGGVKLGVPNAQAVNEAWRDITSNVARHLPDARLLGCSVHEMVRGGIEMLLGIKWDPQFGAVVMAGAGGTLVEIMDDVALALAPLTLDHARALLQSLKIWRVLNGARGERALDVDALADALVRLSWIAVTAGPRLSELDINPLLVQEQGVVALDARATMQPTDV